MEKSLDSTLLEIQGADVIGCLVADKHGLCLSVSGVAKQEHSGIISALAEQAAKLEPSMSPPAILLENDGRKCLIKQCGDLTGAIFKSSQSS